MKTGHTRPLPIKKGRSDEYKMSTSKMKAYEDRRKKIHNKIEDLKGAIRVFIRVLVPKLFWFLQQQKQKNLDDEFKDSRNFVNKFCIYFVDI